jgi:tRNA (mo5U34)-methyltransferase
MFSKQEKLDLVNSYKPWWHSIDFGDDVISNGRKSQFCHYQEIKNWFPSDFFTDKRVLDVGTWDGYYAFHAEKMGAKEVVAVDHFMWNVHKDDTSGNRESKRGFDIAKKLLNSNVKEYDIDIDDMKPDMLGMFDSIIYAGVFYHLKNPYKSIEILDSLLNTNGRIMIESHMCNINNPIPLMQFHPKASLNNDSCNYWSPNGACLKAIFEEIGNYTIESLIEGGRGTMVVRKN